MSTASWSCVVVSIRKAEGSRLAAVCKGGAGYSSIRDGSTLTPGPMVEESVTFFT